MDFIRDYWWLWMSIMISSYLYMKYNHAKRKRANAGFHGDIMVMFGSLQTGAGPLMVAGVLLVLSGVLTLLSIIIQMVLYLPKNQVL